MSTGLDVTWSCTDLPDIQRNLLPPSSTSLMKEEGSSETSDDLCRNTLRHMLAVRQGKGSLGRSRCRWKNNSKVHFKVIVWKGVSWIRSVLIRDH
jgi:hypothetical protein